MSEEKQVTVREQKIKKNHIKGKLIFFEDERKGNLPLFFLFGKSVAKCRRTWHNI